MKRNILKKTINKQFLQKVYR